MCIIGGMFLKEWQVTDKIIESIYSQFTFNHLWMTQTQEIITCMVSKIQKWIWQDVYEWGTFLKEWEVTDKVIVSIFFQFTFNLLRMTQTREITFRVLKIHKWIWGMFMSRGKFPKPWQVTDKIIEWLFLQFIFYILWMTQTQEIITHRVSKIHKWIWGDVYDRGKVS